MSDYRRNFVPGGSYFFTIVTYRRTPIFKNPRNVEFLRDAIRKVKQDQPFEINAAVVLPDHMHFIWTLPPGDGQYSKRIGRMKVLFTRSIRGEMAHLRVASASRKKHRESDVWQRRFWEHTIDDESEFEAYFNYVHYNPVKHGLVSCPHLWRYSSFRHWVQHGVYEQHWGCHCDGRIPEPLKLSPVEERSGEP